LCTLVRYSNKVGLGDLWLGYHTPWGGEDVVVCKKNLEVNNYPFGINIIHEWAHTCGWAKNHKPDIGWDY
jgi:hypothetical protein